MARIRSVHPGLFTDEAFATLSMGARVLLFGIWTEADDRGVFEWKPVRLKVRIFPADLFAPAKVADFLDEMVKVEAVKRFEIDGREYGAVRNFCKWQRPKAPQYLHPCTDDIASYVAHKERQEDGPERGTALGKMLLEQQNGVCFYCERELTSYRKKANSLEIDHRTPISRGGNDVVANLAATCRECNSLKAKMTEQEFRDKFAPSELRGLYSSPDAKINSHSAKGNSQVAKSVSEVLTNDSQSFATSETEPIPPEGEIPPQMEDEGGRREEGNKEDGDLTVTGDKSPRAPSPLREAVGIWNEVCGSVLAPVRRQTEQRKRKFAVRFKADFASNMADWRDFCERVVTSNFLIGGGEKGWRADFDWVLEPSNVTNILEGRYVNRVGTVANGRESGATQLVREYNLDVLTPTEDQFPSQLRLPDGDE